MKAIYINADDQTVSEVDLPAAYPNGNKLIGADLITVAHCMETPTGEDTIYVDDEGLLKEPTVGFFFSGAHQPFAGSGFIMGCDHEGETTAATITVEEVRERVSFLRFE